MALSLVIEILAGLFVAGGVALVLFFRFRLVVVTVRSQSMSPTLEDGDRVLVWRNWPLRWLRRGQIAIVWPRELPVGGPPPFGVATPYIKRIVALPGEVVLSSLSGLQELIRADQQRFYDPDGQREWNVPAGHIFVQGDFPLAVSDSRIWGPIPVESVRGIVVMTFPRQGKHSLLHASGGRP